MGAPDNTPQVTHLPALWRALERRYPGVTISVCELRRYADGREGVTCSYRADVETLLRYGLAKVGPDKYGITGLLVPFEEFEITGGGAAHPGQGAYVCHHTYDGNPRMPGTRQWPPKWVEKEVARIWRCIT